MYRTIDVAALVHAAIKVRLPDIRLTQGALTDTLDPAQLPAVIYEVAAPASVLNAPHIGVGTSAQVVLTAIGTEREQARDTADTALTALLDAVGDPDTPYGWLSRVTVQQEPVAVSTAAIAGATLYQYTTVADVIARRNRTE